MGWNDGNKSQKERMQVLEISMLKYMSWAFQKDWSRNEYIRARVGVTDIRNKEGDGSSGSTI